MNLLRLFIAGIILISAPTVCASLVYAQSYDQQVRKIDSEIKELDKKKKQQTKEKKKQEKLLKRKSREIADLKKQLEKVAVQIKQQTAAVDTLKQRVLKEQQLKAKNSAELTALVRSTYKLSSVDYVKLLLSQQNPNEIMRATDYFRYLARVRDERISALKLSLSGLDESQQELEQQLLVLQKNQAEFNNKQKKLQKKNKERKKIIAQLGTDINSADKQIKQLKQNQSRLTKLIAKLKKEQELALKKGVKKFIPKKGGFEQQKGRMLFPVDGKTVQNFGKRINNSRLLANGLSIRVKSKSEVRAIFDGQVIFASWLKGFGNLIIVDHGNGYMSLYGNNDVLYKKVGQIISARDVIANTSHDSKNADFYFEIRRNGKPINPTKWCRR